MANSSFEKNIYVILGIGVIIFILFSYQQRKESSLEKHQKHTVGQILKLQPKYKTGYTIKFKYLVEGIWIEGSDPKNASWPEYSRKGRIIEGDYHKVVYDATDIENSKIIIDRKPLSEKEVNQLIERNN
ncbi:hypothetical protein ACFO3O_12830 [Dokdonia ponticola]|uniref:DUF3592 domain-containing protein n=1 Tax=Dokdonia ponticola TaxID=2041041 RepID=A0ABV9HXB4_9FLAO